ncbi:hypothetical protein [Micromonospora taraxaci]|uniref:hypothetical protein n=1 Tax=Micromonospora taraxaci TaxID=1316803 RepID=UPI0033BD7918
MTAHDDERNPPDVSTIEVSSDNGEALPYQEVTDRSYAAFAAENFTVEEPEPGTLVLRGPCPRCRSIIDIPLVHAIVRSSRFLGTARAKTQHQADEAYVEPVICTCEDTHATRPDGRYGCGAYWTMIVHRQEP